MHKFDLIHFTTTPQCTMKFKTPDSVLVNLSSP